VVGPSDTGKSTLVDLLTSFVSSGTGLIRMDGRFLHGLDIEE